MKTADAQSFEAFWMAVTDTEDEELYQGPRCSSCGRRIVEGTQCTLCIELDALDAAPDTLEDAMYEALRGEEARREALLVAPDGKVLVKK